MFHDLRSKHLKSDTRVLQIQNILGIKIAYILNEYQKRRRDENNV